MSFEDKDKIASGEKTKGLLYEDAKALFFSGKAIRRASWEKDHFIAGGKANFPGSDALGDWEPTNHDATAQDWEVVDEKKVEKVLTAEAKEKEKENEKREADLEKKRKEAGA